MIIKQIFKKRKFYLLSAIILNVFACVCSFAANEGKFNASPLSYLWEFFTVHWCVWNSLLTILYSWWELNRSKKISYIEEKNQNKWDIIVAISNLINTVVFSATLIAKPEIIGKGRSWRWWTYSIVWHYLAPIISLIFFFYFVKKQKEIKLKKKDYFYFIIHPLIFFLANMMRRSFENPTKYLEGKFKFKKFMVPMFEWVEEGKLLNLSFFIITSLSLFFLVAFLLVKIKITYFPRKERRLIAFNKKNKTY